MNEALNNSNAARGAQMGAENAAGARREPLRVEAITLNGLLANKLLAGLPHEDFANLLPHLEPVSLACGEDLYKFEEDVHFAYFPENAVFSRLHVLADGSMTETALIGSEGMTGLSAIFNPRQLTSWTRVLIAGSALRIESAALKQEFNRGRALQRMLLSYAGARLAQISQKAVCNGRHKLDERLCSWLLLIQERAGQSQLPLTHEQIACHLGVRRAGVTVIAKELRDKDIISYTRGSIRIVDRSAMEAFACECYRALSASRN